ncbi:MAG: hypothetical protein ACK5TR_08550 [Alphaproteobacteria bacterium]|jgi:hypothetical protein|nr:hypothetical protein [Alphaproteobacteria bacterium]
MNFQLSRGSDQPADAQSLKGWGKGNMFENTSNFFCVHAMGGQEIPLGEGALIKEVRHLARAPQGRKISQAKK